MQQAKKYFFVGDARKKKVLEFNVIITTFLSAHHSNSLKKFKEPQTN